MERGCARVNAAIFWVHARPVIEGCSAIEVDRRRFGAAAILAECGSVSGGPRDVVARERVGATNVGVLARPWSGDVA